VHTSPLPHTSHMPRPSRCRNNVLSHYLLLTDQSLS
jgi:hypothetical protein